MLTKVELEALKNPKTDAWIKKNSKLMHEFTRRIWAHEPTEDIEAILFSETNQP
jgi:hypothetical protein